MLKPREESATTGARRSMGSHRALGVPARTGLSVAAKDGHAWMENGKPAFCAHCSSQESPQTIDLCTCKWGTPRRASTKARAFSNWCPVPASSSGIASTFTMQGA